MTPIEAARSLIGLRELTGHNDGPVIDKMLDFLGLPHGLSWCLAFCLYSWHLALAPGSIPYPKIARCSTFLEQVQSREWKYDVYDQEDVAWKIKTPKPGTIMIFAHSKIAGNKNWNGHAALFEKFDGKKIVATEGATFKELRNSFCTIEGNTNKAGSREGDGVYNKVRSAKMGSLTLEGFVDIRKN